MKKQTAYIFAAFIVVLIILAIVIMWLTGGIGGDKPEATPTPATETSAPRQTQFVIPTATQQPTEAVPTETPAATATPAPAPTPEAPSGTVIGSGAFDSATGVGLNTHTAWTATEQADGSVKLTLSVYARSYTMEIGRCSIAISVNGSTSGGMTRSFSVDSPNSQTDTLIYTYSTTVQKGSSVSVSVDWNYKGQYSGQDLDVISSSSTIF